MSLGLGIDRLPALSTGIFGFPKNEVPQVILAAILGVSGRCAVKASLKRCAWCFSILPAWKLYLDVFDKLQSEWEVARH